MYDLVARQLRRNYSRLAAADMQHVKETAVIAALYAAVLAAFVGLATEFAR